MAQNQLPESGPVQNPQEVGRKALVTGLELARNAIRSTNLEELQFILVNDMRALLTYDRALLLVHLGGKSQLVATNNQPKLESKSGWVQRINEIAAPVRQINRGLVLFSHDFRPEGLSEETASILKAYMDDVGCSCSVIVPMSVRDSVIGHLVLEFFDSSGPGEIEVLTLMNLMPFFSAALMEKWMLAADGRVGRIFYEQLSEEKPGIPRKTLAKYLAAGFAVLTLILLFPITMKVGGKAEASPEYEYSANIQMDGIVEQVLIKEGDSVKSAQVLAVLDSKELDYKMREAQRLVESYSAEMQILRNLAAENPSKLAESQLVALKRLRSQLELDFLTWQKQFLNVKSPVDGIILTRRIESLVGKKFKAGESFCKIAPQRHLVTEIFVKESDISYVAAGQKGDVFFNYQPSQTYPFIIKSIAPKSEPMERVGGVFRVRAEFDEQPPEIKPGMQGFAQIATQKESLWFILTRRLKTRINEFFLHF